MKFLMTVATAILLLSGPAKGFANDRIFRDGCEPDILAHAEQAALPDAAKVLAQARIMTVEERCILRGACWDYIDAVWNRAGFPEEKRETIFRSKKRGPYARSEAIRPGDWLYFINHSYGDIEHSALFVAWADRSRHQAYMLSYAGQQRDECARYKRYDISGVFEIIRAKD
jgi:hypothetical protein